MELPAPPGLNSFTLEAGEVVEENPNILGNLNITEINVSAPGKVILHGEHSVVYGKLAIAASLGLRTQISLRENTDNHHGNDFISIELTNLNVVHKYDLKVIEDNLLDGTLPLIKNVSSYNLEKPDLINHDKMVRKLEEFVDKSSGSCPLIDTQRRSLVALFYLFSGILTGVNFELPSFKLRIKTNLKIGAGTGSSASFAVCLAALFLQLVKIKCSRKERNVMKGGFKSWRPYTFFNLDRFDEHELQLISKWALCGEKILHGAVASGIDNTICTFGSMVEYRKSMGFKLIELPSNFKVLLVDSGVPRETKTMVHKVAVLRDNHQSIIDHVLEAMNQVSESALKIFLSTKTLSYELPESGLMFKYFVKLGELADLNHRLLQTLGVSHPKLDEIVSIMDDVGFHGKLTGAGGGGFAIALIPPDTELVVIENALEVLKSKGFQAVVTDLGGPGVTIEKQT